MHRSGGHPEAPKMNDAPAAPQCPLLERPSCRAAGHGALTHWLEASSSAPPAVAGNIILNAACGLACRRGPPTRRHAPGRHRWGHHHRLVDAGQPGLAAVRPGGSRRSLGTPGRGRSTCLHGAPDRPSTSVVIHRVPARGDCLAPSRGGVWGMRWAGWRAHTPPKSRRPAHGRRPLARCKRRGREHGRFRNRLQEFEPEGSRFRTPCTTPLPPR
jgi:hypothetical protein